jgi:hypothetical protein
VSPAPEPEAPRSLRDPEAREARRRLLTEPHVRPLTQYVEGLRARSPAEFPDFDPLDGGVEARLLFLMEKPGPMTSAERDGRQGSGFISRDNDDPTAQAIFTFMREAGIPRRETVLWNLIPGWNGERRVTGQEKKEGVREALRLVRLLPNLKAVVLVGAKAGLAAPLLEDRGLIIRRSRHPSPIVRGTQRKAWDQIGQTWGAAYRAVNSL